jgi:hypothetical protein
MISLTVGDDPAIATEEGTLIGRIVAEEEDHRWRVLLPEVGGSRSGGLVTLAKGACALVESIKPGVTVHRLATASIGAEEVTAASATWKG